jgi:hypothetical protein
MGMTGKSKLARPRWSNPQEAWLHLSFKLEWCPMYIALQMRKRHDSSPLGVNDLYLRLDASLVHQLQLPLAIR